MSCLTSSTRTEIKRRIERLKTQITKANDALDDLLDAGSIESYTFDSEGGGTGKQSAKRRKVEELEKSIENMERRLDHLKGRLDGTGLVSLRLRR